MNANAATAAMIAMLTLTVSPQASAQEFSPEQIRKGADIYAQNCSPCHGARMLDPDAAFDLRKFPPGEKSRFVNSVTRGKNQMPPWGDLLQSDDIDALWAYVRAGER
jgi:mono/diheme cytochrome c family protein